MAPEHAVVLEIRDGVDAFHRAVKATDHIEWLAEIDGGSVDADEEFWIEGDGDGERKAAIRRKLFLVMVDQKGIATLRALWAKWVKDAKVKFPHGLAKWRQVFERLHDVRLWGTPERLEETGVIEAWEDDLEAGLENIRFEVELWWRMTSEKRTAAVARVKRLLAEAGGSLLAGPVLIEGIRYCALVGELPRSRIESLLERQEDIGLAVCDHIMFFRPRGQASLAWLDSGDGSELAVDSAPDPEGSPRVALLDGLPLENHDALGAGVLIDDPDDWAALTPVEGRCHGTAMASVILNGDLGAPGIRPRRPLYVRPILRFNPQTEVEEIPNDQLSVDLVHRSLLRMFEGAEPVAPDVKVINLSVGDRSRPFDGGAVSPWARLLDWASHRYGVLFVVSAGNRLEPLQLHGEPGLLDDKTRRPELTDAAVQAWFNEKRLRRILTPAESVNALTVGALNLDSGDPLPKLGGSVFDPLCNERLPSTTSPLGLGFRRSIKPDVVMPGGRVPYRRRYGSSPGGVQIEPASGKSIPLGIGVASPSPRRSTAGMAFSRGTSNAAALATRGCSLVLERLEAMRARGQTYSTTAEYDGLVAKALLAHAASWPVGENALTRLIQQSVDPRVYRDELARALGFGEVGVSKALECTDYRATAFNAGRLGQDEGLTYALPLPSALSGSHVHWRIKCTLAWFTPINPESQRYRGAAMWMDMTPDPGIRLSNVGPNLLTSRRGTVEQAVYDLDGEAVFPKDAALDVRVNCRSDGLRKIESVMYALVCSVEVAEASGIKIFAEVQSRLRSKTRVRLRQRG